VEEDEGQSDLIEPGKVEMGASPSGPAPSQGTIPTDICPSDYKSYSEKQCHIPAKVTIPWKATSALSTQKSPLSSALGDKGKEGR